MTIPSIPGFFFLSGGPFVRVPPTPRTGIAGTPTVVDLPILAKWKIAANLGTVLRFHWLTYGRTTPQWIDYPPPVDIKF